jgi:hypothetical protein
MKRLKRNKKRKDNRYNKGIEKGNVIKREV